MGFISEIKPISSPVINVTLQEDADLLEEIVIVDYGSIKKKETRKNSLNEYIPRGWVYVTMIMRQNFQRIKYKPFS